MKVTTKNISNTRVELTVTLDATDWKKYEKDAITRLSKEVKVSGFRKGKVPANIAKKNLNPNDISTQTVDIAVRYTVPLAFHEAKKQALAIPKVDVKKIVPGELIEYVAEGDVLPEIKLGNFKNLKVKREDTKVTEKDIKEVLENVQSAYAEKQVAKKKAEMGDEVVIDFEGTKDGVKFDGGSAKDFKLVLGSKQFIPGFEEGCVGHESGDRFDIPLTFPKDYHNKDLAGKKANFNVLVKQVSEIKKPELNDEFAKKCGPFKKLDELKADIKKNLEMQNKAKADEAYKNALVEALVKASKVSAPEILIKDQIDAMRRDISANIRTRQGISFEDALKAQGLTDEDWQKDARPMAEQRVKASLCLQVLANEQKITVSDDLVDAKLAELKEVYKKSPDALKQLKDPNVRMDIKNRLTIEETLNFLAKSQK